MPVNLILAPAELRHPQLIMGSTAVLRLLLLRPLSRLPLPSPLGEERLL